MGAVSLQDLQRDVAGMLRRVEAGEHLVVTSLGKPVAHLTPIGEATEKEKGEPRPFGLCVGQFSVPDDFDAPLSWWEFGFRV